MSFQSTEVLCSVPAKTRHVCSLFLCLFRIGKCGSVSEQNPIKGGELREGVPNLLKGRYKSKEGISRGGTA